MLQGATGFGLGQSVFVYYYFNITGYRSIYRVKYYTYYKTASTRMRTRTLQRPYSMYDIQSNRDIYENDVL